MQMAASIHMRLSTTPATIGMKIMPPCEAHIAACSDAATDASLVLLPLHEAHTAASLLPPTQGLWQCHLLLWPVSHRRTPQLTQRREPGQNTCMWRAAAHLPFTALLPPVQTTTRIYYIGAVEEYWDYAPTGKNQITGQKLTEDKEANKTMRRGSNRIGKVYKKAIFKQFTDDSYSHEIAKPSWLGVLGPVLKAEEKDTFTIHFKNFASRPYSVHPHGVFYKKDSEGAIYPDGTSGKSKEDDFVLPGTNYTYTWPVSEDFVPTPADPPCLTWIYHSHINSPKDISSGLIGPLLVCKKGFLDNISASSADNFKGFALMFSNIDENFSWYLDENINTFCLDPSTVDKEDEDFQLSNSMLSINGYMYGNLPGLEMCAGDLVSWYLIGMGSELDVHSVHFFDHVLINRGCRTDVISLFPATFVTARMVAQNIGKWLVNCEVNHHMPDGMSGLYSIKSCGQNITPSWSGHKRKYFIAAERILWDYGPGGINTFTGQPLNAADSDSAPYFRQGDDRIGGRYWKVHYVAYTDGSFSRKKKRPASEAHLGIL
ncbi:ferroxidase HEPHL1, partial [Crotalus tigris]|uniref:ferroxidase HEPHL1 n=1 Tax=Crotalus tigris TaxID=88082 RepID=UPI00192F85D2